MVNWFSGGKSAANATPTIINRVGDFFGMWGSTSAVAPALSHKSALETSTVLACVKTISEGVAMAPLRLIETYSDDDLERTRIANDHYLHKLLQRPNSFQTNFEFVEGMVANAVLGKGALAIKVIVAGKVKELLPVASGVWVQEQLSTGSYQFRVNFSDGTQKIFSADQVVFFRGLSLDSMSSASAIENARKSIGIANSLEDQGLNLAANGGRPSGILSFGTGISETTKEQLRTTWQERYKPGGLGGVAVLDGTTDFKPISQNAVDSQFIENRRFQVQEIARIFKVQPAFLFADNTKIDAVTMRFHVSQTLMPWFKRFEQALNRDLLGKDADKYHFDFDEKDLLRGDFSELTKLFDSCLGRGGQTAIMTPNECRYELGLDPSTEEWASKLSKGGYAEAAGMHDKPTTTQTDTTDGAE